MRAAVLQAVGDEKLDVRDDVTAEGPGPGQVRVRIRAPGIDSTVWLSGSIGRDECGEGREHDAAGDREGQEGSAGSGDARRLPHRPSRARAKSYQGHPRLRLGRDRIQMPATPAAALATP